MKHELWHTEQVSGYGHGWNGQGGGWRGIEQLVLVRITHEFIDKPDKPKTIENHYYLTSLPAANEPRGKPEALLRLARQHWWIENKLNHKKDRSMAEDQQRCKRGACVMSHLRGLALGLLQPLKGASTAMKQITVAAKPNWALRMLKAKTFPVLLKCDF